MTEFPQRQIGRTGLRVTELGLGCATLGGSQIAVARATAEQIVSAAWAAGVRYVDTAPHHGSARSSAASASVEGAYVVVNGGDILHRWTNERFLSTPHRVRNVSGEVRYAIPFFCDPDHDTMIECLPSCRWADKPAKYPPIRFGDYALWCPQELRPHGA